MPPRLLQRCRRGLAAAVFTALVASPLAVLTFAASTVAAAGTGSIYYIDSAIGDDVHDGMAAVARGRSGPWRTLSRLTKADLKPGDTVVLACGSEWHETLRLPASGTAARPISVVASEDGCSAAPTIDGSVALPASDWTTVRESVRQIVTPDPPLQLFSADGLWTAAHHPNQTAGSAAPRSVYLPMAGKGDTAVANGRAGSVSVVTGSDLRLPADFRVTADLRVRIRTNAWAIEERAVAAIDGNRLRLRSPTTYPTEPGWGYFLLGQAWMVDSPGEWHYDPSTKTLTAWRPDPVARDIPVFATVLPTGVDLGQRSYVHVRGLRIRKVGLAMQLRQTTDVQMNHVTIEDAAGIGADASGSKGLLIADSSFTRTGQDAIQACCEPSPAEGLVVRHCSIRGSGVVVASDVVQSLPVRSFAAIYAGPNAVIEDNDIVDSGYIGIRFMPGSRIERNVVQDSCRVLDDCGAIYTWGKSTKGTEVRGNLVLRSRGSLAGKPEGIGTAAQGIYLDDDTSGVIVQGNTVIDADNGIQIHNAFDNQIVGNRLFGHRRSALWLQDTTSTLQRAGDVHGNRIEDNQIALSLVGSVGIRLDTPSTVTAGFGRFAGNRYLDRLSATVVQERTATGLRSLAMAHWQGGAGVGAADPVDARGGSVSMLGYAGFVVAGANLVPALGASNGASGWTPWNAGRPEGRIEVAPCPAGRCLSYSTGAAAGTLSSPNFAVRQSQWYRLALDFRADSDDLPVALLVRRGGGTRTGIGFESLADRNLAFRAQAGWHRYAFVFQATKTVNVNDRDTGDRGARIDIEGVNGGSTIALANVELVPVAVDPTHLTQAIAVNLKDAPAGQDCPLPANQQSLCSKLRRLDDDKPVRFPIVLPARTAQVLYAIEPALVDSDGDGIADNQDTCPGTPRGLAVNAAGCPLVLH